MKVRILTIWNNNNPEALVNSALRDELQKGYSYKEMHICYDEEGKIRTVILVFESKK